jgi:putative colanic acid biosynthesis UDP-glucose lipid carrier transferase
MQRGYRLSIRSKIIADLALLILILFSIEGSIIHKNESFIGNNNLLTVFACVICWFISGRMLGLYTDFRERSYSIEWVVFLKSLGLYTLLISFFLIQFLKFQPMHRMDLMIHILSIFSLFPFQKLGVRLLFKRLRKSNSLTRKVLIIGARDTGMDFYQHFVKNKQYGYKLTGFLDDIKNPLLNGDYLGSTNDLDNIIENHELDEIIVTLPSSEANQIDRIVSIGEREGKRIRIIPDYQRFGNGKLEIEKLGTMPVITLRSLPLDIVDNKIFKRFFDIIFSSIVIICVFSWLFPIIAILIKISSKGPVFFKQERWGLNNRTIICYKFRSMLTTSTDVDEAGKYRQASKDDPRITTLGKFLRKSNLDEMPQFFNVLFGSMSVVGPRPHPVPLNVASKDHVEKYMMRHWVKPGITGWAQVNGYRGETKKPYLMKKRVEFDLWYIENWTFWLDLQIIVQTLVNMVKGEKNAF